MVGWHHRLDGHEFEEALGVGDGQISLVYQVTQTALGSTQLNLLYNRVDLLALCFTLSYRENTA